MTPVPVQVGNCHSCGAPVYLGQTWCHRCFTAVVPAVLPPATGSSGPQGGASRSSPAHDGVSELQGGDAQARPAHDGASGSHREPVGNGEAALNRSQSGGTSDAAQDPPDPAGEALPEADTSTWKAVHLASETWDLAEGQGDQAEYPMTRMEIRHARAAHRRKGRKRRLFRRLVLAMTTLVALAGLVAGGYLVWQRDIELTPARYAGQVRAPVDQANRAVASIQTLVAQVSLSDVPTAGQVLEARTARRSFASCASRLSRIAAPASRRLARADLMAGCRNYAYLMGDITAVGGTNVLVDMGAFNHHLTLANRSWSAGASAIGVTPVTVTAASS